MIYIIDGHNLIGKMPDIQLSDPDDEEKMVRKLQDWCRLSVKRRVQVVFDAGPNGGFGALLSGMGVNVRFSRLGQTADEVIIKQIKQIRNPPEYTLISSDRAIIDVARKRKVGYILSEEFVSMMLEDMRPKNKKDELDEVDAADPGETAEPEISEDDLNVWLNVFKEPKDRTPEPLAKDVRAAPPPIRRAATVEELKDGEVGMTDQQMDEWLEMFGDTPETPPKPRPKPTPQKPVQKPKLSNNRPPARKRPKADDLKSGDESLSDQDLDEWLRLFGEE